jgi:polyisoprenoid-binding protein YceI
VHHSSTLFRRVFYTAMAAAVYALAMPTVVRADVTVDPAHTSANFSTKHLTLTTVSGTIAVKSATIAIGPADTLTSAKADLDLSTIDTKEADRDADLRSDHWFDVAHYPTMAFASTRITGDKNAMTIAGTLTFHGATHPVTLLAKYAGAVTDGRGRTHVGYTATGTIDRTVWGLGPGYPPAIVGNDIAITIELEAIRT